MNKQEVIDSINNVIVANDQKGITAESLARVLLDMLEVTPESSGGGMIFLKIGEGSDLTEADKMYNATIYEQAQNGSLSGPLALYMDDIYLISPFIANSEDKVEILFGFPDYFTGATNGYLQMVFQLDLYADGSISVIPMY